MGGKKKKKLRKFGLNPTIDKHNPCILKFRQVIAKHFLSKTLEELEKLDYNTINVTFCLLMSHFKKTLSEMFPVNKTKSIM